MLHPSYKEMINKINDTRNKEDLEIKSRYSLVIAAAKRARQINSGSEPLVPSKRKEKNLSVAVDELYAGRVHILENDADQLPDDAEAYEPADIPVYETDSDVFEDEETEEELYADADPEITEEE